MSTIVKVYWRSIKRGTRTFRSVPEDLQSDVKKLARQDVVSGEISAEAYERYIGAAYDVPLHPKT